ncbi:potassium uptake protein [Methylobacillus sp. MM3]|jgi:KUP system potassium uptake protein|uniref:potassium uptake protein n=1 Tax=Methylobacillus sp. MM3 TaxID=1848039 RepID=UPI0007DFD27A|nr:potassium uptake protein [Methylobacillus sp. MM3]OAJ71080.1 potassium uptake protein [Methylobacillus sp. MM3]
MASTPAHKSGVPALAFAALGVVFGDIGTSPLYTMKEVFASHHPVPVTPENVLGVLSLILWALIMVVTVKYVAFVMRADNRGEGGIMALIALATQQAGDDKRKLRFIMLAGIIGACMFFADGMITPAISVLSAVEGLEVAAPQLHTWIIPITLTVLFILFSVQRHGTATVGKLFGPIMLLWFGTLAVLGILNILHDPAVLRAVNPIYAVHFFMDNHWLAFVALGAVVLAVTGGETLYADMGHFGRLPIRIAWFGLVLPSLLLNYFGQGALLLHDPAAVKSPFYLLAPEWMLYPLIALATLATVIASQAVISGTFSVSRQALQLGYMPRTQIQHTSESEAGQIYLPRVNWGLMVAVMVLVIGFGSSSNLAAAYGIAVTGDMVITTLLAAMVFHGVWKWNWPRTLAIAAIFLTIDLAFFGANILKIPAGGWFPLLVGVVIFTLMLTWKKGRELLYKRLADDAMELDGFIHAIGAHPPTRVPGTAIFMTPNPAGVPHAMLHNLKHNKVLHKQIVLVTVKIQDVPHIAQEERVSVEKLPHEFYRVVVEYGFKDDPDLPRELECCVDMGLNLDVMDTSFFIGKETLIARRDCPMAFWRQKIFIGLFRNADSVTNYFKLPPNRVVELGAQVTL